MGRVAEASPVVLQSTRPWLAFDCSGASCAPVLAQMPATSKRQTNPVILIAM